MKKKLSILLLLVCLKTTGQINLSLNNVYQSGYDQIMESIYYTEFKKQGVSLFLTNEERKLGIISLADSLGNTLCLSDFKGNGELNSCTIYAPALDDVMLRYYLSGGNGVPCELPLCNPSDDFCLIEELNSKNPVLGIGYYFIENESPRISRFRFENGAKDNFSIPLLLNTQQYSIVSELDAEGNGIKKTYNNEGKLIHSSLYKNGIQVDYRSYP